jgi:hypothetical protein
MTATAYERILDKLRDQGKRVRQGQSGKEARAQCPSHDSRRTTSLPLAVYSKSGKAKVVCFVGCSDLLDILPALGMTVADLYDEPKQRGSGSGMSYREVCRLAGIKTEAEQHLEARIEARRTMTPAQRGVDDLLQLPDLGERLSFGSARIRPELYIWEREQLDGEPA